MSVTAADEGMSTLKDETAAVDGALDAVMAMLNKSRSGSAAGIPDLTPSPLRAVVIEKSPIKKEDYPSIPSSAETSPLSSVPSSPVFSPVLPPSDLESETDSFQPSRKTSEAGDGLSHRTRLSRSKSIPPSELTALRPPTTPKRKSPRKPSAKISPYFPKSPPEKLSCIPFPPLSASSFGLVQENLSHDPFRLLLAVIFLNKTKGTVALPTFYNTLARYPTPASLAAAKQEDLVALIQHLGLQNQRAATCVRLAQAWLDDPPQKGKRYRRLHYPERDDGKDIKVAEGPVADEDERVAWEVGHLPGIGAYAIDSWRIFCRDELRGLSHGLSATVTPEAREKELQGEWTRVLPRDKELRAYLRWRWLRLGWVWDPLTGERVVATGEEIAAAEGGGVVREGERGGAVNGGEVVGAGIGRGECGGRGDGEKMEVLHGDGEGGL